MENKKKIVIIGANSFQNPLILKAKALGYETHVFAWQDGSIGERTADHFYPISIVERDVILEKCREIQPDAVASIGSDLAMLTVNYVAGKLGCPATAWNVRRSPQINMPCGRPFGQRACRCRAFTRRMRRQQRRI